MGAPSRESRLASLAAPLRADAATVEVLLAGDRDAAEPRGQVVLYLEPDVLGTSTLASGHARHHAHAERLLVLGYTPYRVLHERVAPEFAARLLAPLYEARCDGYERNPAHILTDLWGGSVSMRREHWLALDMAGLVASGTPVGLEAGERCLEGGLEGVFDRSLRALRLYEPSLAGFADDARSEGAQLAALGRLQPSARAGVAGALASLALRGLLAGAGSAQVWRLQDIAARRLWELERRRGAALV